MGLSRNGLLILILLSGYGAVAGFTQSCHELWRDEWQTWLMPQESHSLSELRANVEYDPHPRLWYLILYTLSRVTSNPIAMQIFELGLGCLAIALFFVFSPFGRLEKGLFAFGYFPLYEYVVISRHYALGMVCVFALCAVYPHRHKRPFLFGSLLFLLCQTHVYGVMIALAFGAALLFEDDPIPRQRIAFFCALLAGAAFSIPQMILPADTCKDVVWRFGWDFQHLFRVLGTLWRAYVPLPRPGMDFWSSDLLSEHTIVRGVLGVCLLMAALSRLSKNRAALVFCAAGSSMLVLFSYVKFYGSIRHHGHLFLVLLAAFWLAPSERESWKRMSLVLLICQATAGLYACAMDIRFPFSGSKQAADYLKSHGLADALLVGDEDYMIVPIAGYLGRKFYYPRGDRWATYVIENKARSEMDPYRMVEMAQKCLLEQGKDRLIFVLNYPLLGGGSYWREKVFETDKTFVSDEHFYLYEMRKPRKAGLAGPVKFR